MNDLRGKTVSALLWNGVDKVLTNLIYLFLGVFLARLLSPDDYGVMGILNIFISFSTLFVEGGLMGALIRKRDVLDVDYNTIFYYNLVVSVFLYLLFYALAPVIASFYNDPNLALYLRVTFVVIIVNALGLAHFTRMTRDINFRAITLTNTVGLFVAGVVAVVAAFMGLGIWALILQVIVFAVVKTVIYWIRTQWTPSLTYSWESLKGMFGFGLSLMGTGLLNLAYLFSFPMVIGKLFPLSSLGYFTQASKWSDMFSNSISSTLQSTTYPIFSSISDDSERLLVSERKMMRLAAFCSAPVMIGLMLLASSLVYFVLTDKWASSIPYLQLLPVAGFFAILITLNQNYLKVSGNGKKLFGLEVLKLVFTALGILFSYPYGMYAMVVCFVVSRILIYLVYSWAIGREVSYSLLLQLKDVAPYILISLFCAVLCYPLFFLFSHHLWIILSVTTLFATSYFLILKLLGSKIFDDLIELIKHGGK